MAIHPAIAVLVVVVCITMILAQTPVRVGRAVADGDGYLQRIIESQRRTIEAMDRTIRAQWEIERILRRRLGEPVQPPPVSITGLPDPPGP